MKRKQDYAKSKWIRFGKHNVKKPKDFAELTQKKTLPKLEEKGHQDALCSPEVVYTLEKVVYIRQQHTLSKLKH